MITVGNAPPIFSPWRKRAVHGPKDTPGGGFRSPPPGPPLQTTQRGGCGPLFGNSPHGAAAGREAGRIDKHPGMRYYVVACGISVGGEARCSALGWSWANLRKAGYQPPHPQTCPDGQVWTKRLFLPPCTAHSFSPRRKRMGGAMPASIDAFPAWKPGKFPQNLFTFRILFAKLYPAYKKPLL